VPADQQSLANLLYGGTWGRENLGNTQPGDGWKYRGRGLKQLTGRANYVACGKALGEDFVANPERLCLPINAALSAGWFWSANGCNKLAEAGDIPGLTKRINGGSNGLEERTALFGRALETFA
jgi:putative chitinase